MIKRTTGSTASVDRHLRREILSGRLRPGDRVPTERELATALGVSRASVHHAIAALATQGLLAPRRRTGTIVNDLREHGSLDVLRDVFAVTRPKEATALVAGVLELRRLLGGEAVAIACARRTEGDLAAFAAAVEKLRRASDRRAIVSAEAALFACITTATHNLAFALTVSSLRRFWIAHPELEKSSPFSHAELVAHYEKLFGLLVARRSAAGKKHTLAQLAIADRHVLASL